MIEESVILPPKTEVVMTKPEVWLKARTLAQEGYSKSAIARELGLNRRTVRSLLERTDPPAYPSKPKLIRPSRLDPFKDYLRVRLADGVTNAVRLKRELQARGYQGGISVLREFLLPLRLERQREAFQRFETMPGEQAQADWSYFSVPDERGLKHCFYCFVLVLGYSRCLYAEFVPAMDILNLLRCHVHAFDYFGGIPRTILYDNLKQVVIERDNVTLKHHFQPRFLDFARYYAFRPLVCWPNRPQTKGKVENSIRYIRISFAQGLRFAGLTRANTELRTWLDEVANQRTHAETRAVPFERLKQERAQLLPLSLLPYDTARVESRHVGKDCFLSYGGNRYSVPFHYVDKSVTIRDHEDGRLLIYDRDELIAEHRRNPGRGQRIVNPAHTQGITRPGLASQNQWRYHREKLTRVGDIMLEVLAPLVTQRPLASYEELLEALKEKP
jgi:transposase